jgi:hypothetical protein
MIPDLGAGGDVTISATAPTAQVGLPCDSKAINSSLHDATEGLHASTLKRKKNKPKMRIIAQSKTILSVFSDSIIISS